LGLPQWLVIGSDIETNYVFGFTFVGLIRTFATRSAISLQNVLFGFNKVKVLLNLKRAFT
jgi:hypothetical protein